MTIIDEFIQRLANEAHCEFLPSDITLNQGQLQLRLDDVDAQFFAQLMQAIKQQAGKATEAKSSAPLNYGVYLDEVRACPLFKPKNPLLAVRHVAKEHGLEAEALMAAFKGA